MIVKEKDHDTAVGIVIGVPDITRTRNSGKVTVKWPQYETCPFEIARIELYEKYYALKKSSRELREKFNV